MTLGVLDLARPSSTDWAEIDPDIVVAHGDPAGSLAEHWPERISFALTEAEPTDHRWIQVASITDTLAEIEDRVARWPQAAAVCDDVLRAGGAVSTLTGVITESLAYSTLQSGPEFRRWLTERGPSVPSDTADPIRISRDENRLGIQMNRPHRHNAFDTTMRGALLEALAVAVHDTTIDEVVLSGAGPSFCSGGDLAEFGSLADPASAHLARTRHSPALVLDGLTRRLGRHCRAEVHGQVLGSGLEMAAFCGHVTCRSETVLGLPELRLGLIPGAGGTVSITRRIGRWRTSYLVLTGRTIDAATALQWGLVDEVVVGSR